ncbi:hypothetical protein ACFX2C_046019 [Malus domestica]
MANEALLFYSQMKSASPGTKADPYIYSFTLKACTDTRNFKMGKALHCHVLRCLPNPSRIVCNSLLNMYSACYYDFDYSQYDLVRRVFDTMRKRNVVAWNTLVSWYVKTERYAEAVKQFRMMMGMRITRSAVSFVNVFPALSAMGDYKNANVLYGKLLRLGGEYVTDLFVESSAIFMYAELGCLEYARKIFDHCSERNTEIWNTMIGAYVQNNSPIEAIDLFFQAVNSELAILAEVTFLSVLTACSQMQQLELAGQLHAFIIKHLRLMPVILLNATIVMYSRCNSVDMSFKIFHKMPERDVSWNTMISEEAFFVFRQMLEQNLIPNAVTLASVLPSCNIVGNIDVGKQLHGFSIRHYLDQNVFVGSALIDMYSKCGAVTYAENVFAGSHEKNSVTYTTMILGYGQHGMGERALSLFHSMQKSGIAPDAITFVAVLSACSYAGLVNEGLSIYDSMKREYNIKPLMAHYCCIADMLGRVGRMVEAYEFVKGLGEEGDAMEIWGSLLGACRIHKHFELGKIVAGKLLELVGRMHASHILC